MKLLQKSNKIVELTITIEIESESIALDISASKLNIQHPNNVKKRYLLTNSQKDIIQGLVDSVIATLEGTGFGVICPYQGDSYSCYVPFRPINNDIQIDGVLIIFAIINHTKNHKQSGRYQSTDQSDHEVTRIINLKFEDVSFSNSIALLRKVKYICAELCKGNIDVLDEI